VQQVRSLCNSAPKLDAMATTINRSEKEGKIYIYRGVTDLSHYQHC